MTGKRVLALLGLCAAVLAVPSNEVPQRNLRAQAVSDDDKKKTAQGYLASSCHIGTGLGCNSLQIPGYENDFVPGKQLIELAVNSVILGPGSGLDISYTSKSFDSSASWSSEAVSSFGAGATVPAEGAAFSGSVQHKEVVSSMLSGNVFHYFVSCKVHYSAWTARFNIKGASPALAKAVADLPEYSSNSSSDYFTLFSGFGTHFTSSVDFGGVFTQSASVDSNEVENAHFTSDMLSIGLGGHFSNNIGLNISASSSLNQSAQQTFDSFTSYSNLHVFGGDETHGKVDQYWFDTVQTSPKPISTTLQFLGTLFSGKKALDLAQAYHDYMNICPTDSSGVVCGGVGACLFDNNPPVCQCDFTCPSPSVQNDVCQCNCPDPNKCKNGGTQTRDCKCICPKQCQNCGYQNDDCSCKCRGDSNHGWMGDFCETKWGSCTAGPGSGNPDGSCNGNNDCWNNGGGASTSCDVTQVCCNTDFSSQCAPFGSRCSCGIGSCDITRADACVEGQFASGCACPTDP